MNTPLAERIRPKTLEEYLSQQHLVGPKGSLTTQLKTGMLPSLILWGPPGTGKSQTIANMIGALMHAGKSVLFVSEKMAALDVVRNRLWDVGLGSYLLELHSHKANRREVAEELMKTLDNIAQPPGGMSAPSRTALEDRRKKLSLYAMAMNELRSPLESSLHDVLGMLAELVNVPAAPVPHRRRQTGVLRAR